MHPSAALIPLFALLTGLGTFAAGYTRTEPAAAASPPAAQKPQVKLAVLVVFDQMRGDYLDKWKPLFGEGGFARLQAEGAWFTRCYYPYGTTSTGPGHASILTGTCPDRHGIVNNNWYEKGRDVYCAADERYSTIPPPPKASGPADPKAGTTKATPPTSGTPDRLLSETVADVLKQTYGTRAKVFGLSLKDRSAILPTGKRPDGAFWFSGRFVTSTYYTDALDRPFPKWVTTFNASKAADRWFGKPWDRFRSDLDYARYSGRDDAPGEGVGSKQGRTFPHPMTGGLKAVGKEYYEALANSPYGNELLLEFAKACIAEEQLGKDDVPDLLVVSFSSNDLIGHAWGPDSQEVLDVTLRSDAMMANFLRYLDEKVGKGSYALALTADHGICPLPEVKGGGAKRVDTAALRAGAEKHLKATFGGKAPEGKDGVAKAGSGWIEAFATPWLHLNSNLLKSTGRSRAEVASSLASHLAAQPDVYRVFTREDLAGEFPPTDEIGRRVKRSYRPDRCGDVYVVLRPYHLFSKTTATGTTHGTPHGYDAHVPLLVYGPGVRGGARTEAVTPQATAGVFSRFLGIRPPGDADFPVPTTLEGK